MATASHQNEGNNRLNDFWAWEQTPGHIADNSTSGLACDWWNRAEEDFDRAAAMGLNTLRLSVEWSRLEPQPGRWDEAAFDRYREMLHGLHARGMQPMVTLHHFTNPLWLAERGGWLNREVIPLFARFSQKVVAALGDLCRVWATINEPSIYASYAYVLGKWPPGQKSLPRFIRVSRHLLKAHAAATEAIRRQQPEAQVGIVLHLAVFDRPLYVTENGLADASDAVRPAFILTHLAALHRAIRQGVDVRGYYYWTLVDNYEWVEGWTTPFGLIELDPATQERRPRPSASLYGEIARANAITGDMVERYAPQVMDQVFSN